MLLPGAEVVWVRLPATLLLLLLLFLAGAAETWRYSDARGNRAQVQYPRTPSSPLLAKAFRQRFFPSPTRLSDDDFLVDWDTRVEFTLSTPRYFSAVTRGLSLYRNFRGEVVGAHPAKILESLNWDLRKQREIGLADLVAKDQWPRLASLIKNNARIPQAFERPSQRYDFFMGPEGCWFYDPEAPHAAFGLESLVPYAELLPLAASHSPLLDAQLSRLR